MPKTLLLCRLTPFQVNNLSANPFIRKIWPRVIASHQVQGDFRADEVFYDWAVPEAPQASRDFLTKLLYDQKVSHVVASQKGLWYSDILENLCRGMNIELVWSEPFFDSKYIFDKAGLQYSPVTDLSYSGSSKILFFGDPEFPKATREAQLDCPDGFIGRATGKEVVVFGQVPHDMALIYFKGLPYLKWLEQLFDGNPDEQFLFKHHPRMATPGIGRFKNVRVVQDSIHSLFKKFERFAAFSSTTILEGMIAKRRKFITGGYHFCNGFDLSCGNPAGQVKHLDRLEMTPMFTRAFWQRLGFITNAYTLPLTDVRVAKRILMPSDTFFHGEHYTKI